VLGQSDNYRIHGTGVSITAKHELRYARDFRTIYTYQSLGEPYLQLQDGSQRAKIVAVMIKDATIVEYEANPICTGKEKTFPN